MTQRGHFFNTRFEASALSWATPNQVPARPFGVEQYQVDYPDREG